MLKFEFEFIKGKPLEMLHLIFKGTQIEMENIFSFNPHIPKLKMYFRGKKYTTTTTTTTTTTYLLKYVSKYIYINIYLTNTFLPFFMFLKIYFALHKSFLPSIYFQSNKIL